MHRYLKYFILLLCIWAKNVHADNKVPDSVKRDFFRWFVKDYLHQSKLKVENCQVRLTRGQLTYPKYFYVKDSCPYINSMIGDLQKLDPTLDTVFILSQTSLESRKWRKSSSKIRTIKVGVNAPPFFGRYYASLSEPIFSSGYNYAIIEYGGAMMSFKRTSAGWVNINTTRQYYSQLKEPNDSQLSFLKWYVIDYLKKDRLSMHAYDLAGMYFEAFFPPLPEPPESLVIGPCGRLLRYNKPIIPELKKLDENVDECFVKKQVANPAIVSWKSFINSNSSFLDISSDANKADEKHSFTLPVFTSDGNYAILEHCIMSRNTGFKGNILIFKKDATQWTLVSAIKGEMR